LVNTTDFRIARILGARIVVVAVKSRRLIANYKIIGIIMSIAFIAFVWNRALKSTETSANLVWNILNNTDLSLTVTFCFLAVVNLLRSSKARAIGICFTNSAIEVGMDAVTGLIARICCARNTVIAINFSTIAEVNSIGKFACSGFARIGWFAFLALRRNANLQIVNWFRVTSSCITVSRETLIRELLDCCPR
jgi:hypothetical protein